MHEPSYCVTSPAIDGLSTYVAANDTIGGVRDVMVTVRVSPKFQVVIPKPVREELKIQPGRNSKCTYSTELSTFIGRAQSTICAEWQKA